MLRSMGTFIVSERIVGSGQTMKMCAKCVTVGTYILYFDNLRKSQVQTLRDTKAQFDYAGSDEELAGGTERVAVIDGL